MNFTTIEPEDITIASRGCIGTVQKAGGEMRITADHGNLERMKTDDGQPHTQHSVGPVPLVYVGRPATLHHGSLSDIAPTVLAVMGIPQPVEMTGHTLIKLE